MNSKLLVLGFLILAIVVPMITCFSVDAISGVNLEINRFYTDSAGFGHVVLTVMNNTSRPITNVWVHLTYLDSSGEPVGADDGVVVASFMGEIIDSYDSYTTEFIVMPDVNKKASRVQAKITSFDYA